MFYYRATAPLHMISPPWVATRHSRVTEQLVLERPRNIKNKAVVAGLGLY